MRFDEAAIPVRKRGVLEIVDLSVRFYRMHLSFYLKLISLLGLPALLTGGAVMVYTLDPFLAALAFWLVWPLASGGIILSTSRLVFGVDLTLRRAFALYGPWAFRHFALRLLHRIVWLPLLIILVGERLRLGWIFAPMVQMLERLRGDEQVQRCRALSRWSVGNALGFDLVSILFFLINASAVAFVFDLVLADILAVWKFGGMFAEEAIGPGGAVLWMIIFAVVAPLLDIGWFFVYLDARIRGEGWDLELGFRAMGKRLQRQRNGGPS